ncbi:MAG: MFS transporter [Nitrososphaerota archaeon]|nr:MFS transporter [Nitrososphaerota archaeon]
MQYKWTVLTVTTIGVLMSGVDGRIVLIGLPVVAASLHADAEQAIWFTQAYTVGSTVALLFIGRVSDMFGRVKVYSIGFTLFTIGSALVGLSSSPDYFIIARISQGLGSAALFSNSAAIITDAFPKEELGTALGINQIAFRAGSMFGLTMSGIILAFLAWPYLFYINVPIGLFGTVWAYRRLKEVGVQERTAPMDWWGFVTFTIFMTSLLLALTFAAYGLSETTDVLLLLLVSLISLVLFVRVERRRQHPLLDLSLLKIREFTGGIVTQLMNSVAWGSFLLLMSLYLQLVQGYSPLKAGFAVLPFDFAFLASGPLSGKFSDRYGTLPFITAGLALISISLMLFSTFVMGTSYAIIAFTLILGGLGNGLFASPNMSSIMGAAPAARRGVASAVRATFFNVGYTLSFNLVILVMAFSLPYSLITQVISSANPAALPAISRTLFSLGLDRASLVMAVINASAIIPSLLRGKRVPEPEE